MGIRRIGRRGTLVVATILLVLLILPTFSFARHPLEMYPVPDEMYERKWCADHKGATGVKMPDGTNAACITSTHVVEFQFAPKWAEAIGRALYYGYETGKRAGIVLIIDDEKSLENWKRLNLTIEHFKLPIDTWKME
jgi:hypothetical protein